MGQRGPVRHDSAGVCFPSGAWFLFQVAGFLLNRKLGGGGGGQPLAFVTHLCPDASEGASFMDIFNSSYKG